MSAAISGIAAGVTERSDDVDLIDAVFLSRHPEWTWPALQATPERVLRIMNKLETATRRHS